MKLTSTRLEPKSNYITPIQMLVVGVVVEIAVNEISH